MRRKWTQASFSEEREIIPKRWVIRLATVAVIVWGGFGIDSLLTWTPAKPDPRQITRDNFGFEMFSQKRLLGWETRHDVSGAEKKLNELFPPGAPLDEFTAFENSIKVPRSDYERFGIKTFGCNLSEDERMYVCQHHYRGIGILRFENTWMVFAELDINRSVKRIKVYLQFVG